MAEQAGCYMVVTQNAIEMVNTLAPEHLELQVEDPERYLSEVRCAGAIFCGSLAAEAMGDYATGPNHVLPTGGMSRFRSGLSCRDFVTTPTVQWVSQDGLGDLGRCVVEMARMEGLEGHARSIEKRMERCLL